MNFVLNHLWQSTFFAAAAALLTFALRRNHAGARHAVWLAASVKFLVPFSIFIALGQQVPRPRVGAAPAQPPRAVEVISSLSQPFVTPLNIALAPPPRPALDSATVLRLAGFLVWIAGATLVAGRWLQRWRGVARVARAAVPLRAGREFDALHRATLVSGVKKSLTIAAADTTMEPGVFGILRPVLLWPAAISDRLPDDQLDAIMIHEVGHVRRRDNLAAALHMFVEALFWFHPVVWWIGVRLVEERERACDEEVLNLKTEPQAYAEGILKTCEFSIAAPLACVSGVAGSDLSKRIDRIMRGDFVMALSGAKKVLLAVMACAAVAIPIVIGAGMPQRLLAQASVVDAGPAFEVASIKLNASGERASRGGFEPGGRFAVTNSPLFNIISNAYRLAAAQIIGGPSWMKTERYDIVARYEPAARGPALPSFTERQSMLQRLLADRFALKIHHETRELPAANLVMAHGDRKLGPHLQPATEADADCAPKATPPDFSKGLPPCSQSFTTGQFRARGVTMERLASLLASSFQLSPFVFDQTNLEGAFNIDILRYRPEGLSDTPPPDRPADAPWPSTEDPTIYTALQEQLGLKLEFIKGPVDVIVIDSASHPTEN